MIKQSIKLIAIIFAGMLAITSCSKDNNEVVVTGTTELTVNPKTKIFGSRKVNTSFEQFFIVRNTGKTALKISSFTFEGANKSEFTTTGKATMVAVGKTYKFNITFKPTSEGDKKANLVITSNAKRTTVSLTGKGIKATTAGVSITKGDDFKDTRDNTVYPTVKIGNQVWMAKNLSFKVTGKSYAYKNNEANVAKYGRLYLWESLKEAIPTGWHLPTDAEWKVLEKNLGMSDTDLNKIGYDTQRGTNQGKQLKAGGKSLLNFPMAGFRRDDGKYEGGDDDPSRPRTYIWVNTKNGSEVYRRRMEKASDKLYRFTNPTAGFAIAVRLVKD